MRRLFNIALVFVIIGAAAYTYDTKRKAEHAAEDLHRINAQIRTEKETIELLKADWSVLTQPSRLQSLTERYEDTLNLKPLDVDQIVSLGEIPNKPVNMTPFQSNPSLSGYAGGAHDTIQ